MVILDSVYADSVYRPRFTKTSPYFTGWAEVSEPSDMIGGWPTYEASFLCPDVCGLGPRDSSDTHVCVCVGQTCNVFRAWSNTLLRTQTTTNNPCKLFSILPID
jgi:hypothetical protein